MTQQPASTLAIRALERRSQLVARMQELAHERGYHHPDAIAQRSIALTLEDRKLWRGPCGEWHYADLPCSRCDAQRVA